MLLRLVRRRGRRRGGRERQVEDGARGVVVGIRIVFAAAWYMRRLRSRKEKSLDLQYLFINLYFTLKS